MKYRGLLLPMILAAMCGDDAFVLNTKRGKGMQSAYRRDHPHFPTRKCPSEVARQGKYNV